MMMEKLGEEFYKISLHIRHFFVHIQGVVSVFISYHFWALVKPVTVEHL